MIESKNMCVLGDASAINVMSENGRNYARLVVMGSFAGTVSEGLVSSLRDRIEVMSCEDFSTTLLTCCLWDVATGDEGLTSLIDDCIDLLDQCIEDGCGSVCLGTEWYVGLGDTRYDSLLEFEEYNMVRRILRR